MNKKSLMNAFSVAVYVAAIAYLMQNGERFFGKTNNFFGGFAFLLLFVVSAAIVGYQVFGQPVTMYLDGKKKEAITMASQTIGWLTAIIVVVLVILSIIK
jgi:hypothetical protein